MAGLKGVWPPHPRPLSPVSRGRGEELVFAVRLGEPQTGGRGCKSCWRSAASMPHTRALPCPARLNARLKACLNARLNARLNAPPRSSGFPARAAMDGAKLWAGGLQVVQQGVDFGRGQGVQKSLGHR
jgi:hypothetical protein